MTESDNNENDNNNNSFDENDDENDLFDDDLQQIGEGDDERMIREWKSKKYGKLFEQIISNNGIRTDQLKCRKCDRIFSMRSRVSIREHQEMHERGNEKLKEKMIKRCLDVISNDGQPVAFIESEAVKQLIQSCIDLARRDPNWRAAKDLPSERTLRRLMLEREGHEHSISNTNMLRTDKSQPPITTDEEGQLENNGDAQIADDGEEEGECAATFCKNCTNEIPLIIKRLDQLDSKMNRMVTMMKELLSSKANANNSSSQRLSSN